MAVSWATIRSAICWCLLFMIIPMSEASSGPPKKRQVVSGKISLPGETVSPQPAETAPNPAGAATPAASAPVDQAETVSPEAANPAAEVKSIEPAGGTAPESRVVRQPISLPGPATQASDPAPLPQSAAVQSAPQEAELPAPTPDAPVLPLPVKVSDTDAETSVPSSISLPSLLSGNRNSLTGSYAYDPVGKIDPFEPLLKAKPDVVKKMSKKKRPKRVPRTPLEMVDISQLKLSAIISASSGNRALVEEASGKGYVVRVGTPIGIHWGKVAAIKKDRVIVEEEVQDLMGEYVKRNRAMKLNKPIGE